MRGQVINLVELQVLLIEPSAIQARIIIQQFNEIGISAITQVEHAAAAFQALQTMESIDLVISAMYLPDMTGTEVVYAMRANPQLAAVAFMLISSETNPRYLDPIRQSGAIAILPKPFHKAQLQRALLATVDYLSPAAMKLADSDIEIEQIKVLVVDDSLTSRGQIKRLLNLIGISKIAEAASGGAAVPLIENDFFDLVITDYNMPEMDGEGLIRFIREKSGQSSVPVMMISSEADQSRLASVQQAGVSAICDKPMNPKMIRDVIERVLVQTHEENET
jgi:two-component system chemotaxis response regulator CheY